MKATIKLANPGNAEAEITFCATVYEMQQLRDQLADAKWPGWKFAAMLREVIALAEAEWYSTKDAE